MFSSCCTGNISPRQQVVDQVHLNPIHRRIGNKKHLLRNEKTRTKPNSTYFNEQSIIKDCDISALNYTQQNHSAVNTNLINSFIIPHSHLNSDVCHTIQFPSKKQSQKQSEKAKIPQQSGANSRYYELQSKYIGVLQRTNSYLEHQLDKSRASQQESKSQASKSARSRFSSELYQLRNRLNSIDLTNVKKLAKFGLSQDNKNYQVTSKIINKKFNF